MGTLFAIEEDPDYEEKRRAVLLREQGCRLCPLAKIRENIHPDMPASGALTPLVYILGEAPGKDEDAVGRQFVGSSGQLLRGFIPREFRDKVRFNNVVRTRPRNNETPSFEAIECCRPSIIKDIEESKPRALFGFGNVPLNWVAEVNGITAWRGRRMPVKIGSHVCWYYPILHPASLLHQRNEEDERMFKLDVKQAFAEVMHGLPPPRVYSAEELVNGIELLTDLPTMKRALRWAVQQPALGIDYETNDLRPYAAGAKILTAAISTPERAIAFPFEHPQSPLNKAEREDLAGIWAHFLERTKAIKISHNLAFELEWTGVVFGKELIHSGKWEDTMSQAIVLDERVMKRIKPGCLSLEFLFLQYFGINIKKLSSVNRLSLEKQNLYTVLRYNALDAKGHVLLWAAQKERIKKEELQEPYQLQLRRVPTCVLAQIKGAPVDQGAVKVLKKKYEGRVEDLEKAIAALPIIKKFERVTRRAFNPGSNSDCLYVFWDMLQRNECEVTDKKHDRTRYSVDETVLEQIDHSLAKLIIDLRKNARQLSTYILPVLEDSGSNCVIYPDGLVHTSFNTTLTRTGRLSSDSPNLQNYPKRDAAFKEVRRSFAAKPGEVIVSADLGQIEARVIAMFTKDKQFVKALWEDHDVHGEWAEKLARAYPARIGGRGNLTDKKVMKDFRADVKNQWVFPLFFGASVQSAAGYLHIPEETIAPLYREFWKEYSGVKDWQERLLKFYQVNGYVECLTGRRRHGPLSPNRVYNSPVQGTAAEIIMDAMARLTDLKDDRLQPELQIHDDLTWMRVPEKELQSFLEPVLDIILDPPFDWINVPITVEVSIGRNWCDLDLYEEMIFRSDKWFNRKG